MGMFFILVRVVEILSKILNLGFNVIYFLLIEFVIFIINVDELEVFSDFYLFFVGFFRKG